jgi:serine/threonine protein kinase
VNQDQWASVETHFAALNQLPVRERPARLAAIADEEVRREVASLLDRAEGGETVAEAIGAMASYAEREEPTHTIQATEKVLGTQIGPYKLVRELGEGGMGVVYRACQTQPIRRDVALKIIKPGMDSRQVISRFESERQALAMMDHVNIARVFDAGTTASGLPYFVMELVNGIPITHYCDAKRLTLKERIALFIPVCKAIQHAHQKGIIHRDIKPSNVLVTEQDGKPIPKVIDFGLAKALGDRFTDATILTNLGTVVGTLQYMSPEQAELSRQDIDTRSDIYSLGVVLYELLTGTTPLDREQLTKAAYLEVLRTIREEEPATPSARTRRSATSVEIAAQRRTDPSHLGKLLQGELDWITMKALEKDRIRRFETVNGFARDLERFLDGQAVESAPPSIAYRMGKFARRHRVWLAAASTAVAAICIGAGVAIYQARIAQQRFQQVRTLANTFLFQFHDAIADIPGTTKARELVVTTALEYLGSLSKSAGRDDDLKLELAKAYERVAAVQGLPQTANLGDIVGAKASYAKALALYDQVGRRDAAYRKSLAGCLANAAYLDVHQNDLQSARSKAARAAAVLEPLRQDRDAASLAILAGVYDTLAAIGYQSGAPDLGEENVRKGLAEWEEWATVAPASEGAKIPYRLAISHSRLGMVKAGKGWFEEAAREELASLRFAQEAVRLAPSNAGYSRKLADDLVTLSSLYGSEDGASLNQPEEAARYARQAAEILAPLAAADAHDQAIQVNYASALMCLGQALSALKPPQGIQEARTSMEIWRGLRDAKRLSVYEERARLFQAHGLVRVLTRHGRAAEAFDAAQTTVADRRAALASLSPASEYWWDLAADLCLASVTARAAGHVDEAHHLAQEALEQSRPFLATAFLELTTAFDAALVYSTLAQDRQAAGNCAEALEWRAKERDLWRAVVSKSDYAPVRLRAAESSLNPCAGAHR